MDRPLAQCLDPVPAAFAAAAGRRAAVLAVCLGTGAAAELLFVVRRQDLRQHAGQIAFPGGMQEGSEAPAACALREAGEEIALPAGAVTLLGALPPRSSSTGIHVHCLVGRADPALPLRADGREVERLLRVPLADLLTAGRWALVQPPATGGRQPSPSPHFRCGSDVIWGLTGRFAWELACRLRGRPHDLQPPPAAAI